MQLRTFTWVRGLEIGKGRSAKNTSPSSENAKAEQYGSPVKPLSPLREDEVSYEPFTWVRSLRIGEGRFVENTSPHPRVKALRLNNRVHQ